MIKQIIVIIVIGILIIISGCVGNEKNMKDTTIIIERNHAFYYGGDGSELDTNNKFKYDISSDIPIDIYVVPSDKSLESWSKGYTFMIYPKYTHKNVYSNIDSYIIDCQGGILIINKNNEDAKVHIKINYCYF